jgi:hypothetical protein
VLRLPCDLTLNTYLGSESNLKFCFRMLESRAKNRQVAEEQQEKLQRLQAQRELAELEFRKFVISVFWFAFFKRVVTQRQRGKDPSQ